MLGFAIAVVRDEWFEGLDLSGGKTLRLTQEYAIQQAGVQIKGSAAEIADAAHPAQTIRDLVKQLGVLAKAIEDGALFIEGMEKTGGAIELFLGAAIKAKDDAVLPRAESALAAVKEILAKPAALNDLIAALENKDQFPENYSRTIDKLVDSALELYFDKVLAKPVDKRELIEFWMQKLGAHVHFSPDDQLVANYDFHRERILVATLLRLGGQPLTATAGDDPHFLFPGPDPLEVKLAPRLGAKVDRVDSFDRSATRE